MNEEASVSRTQHMTLGRSFLLWMLGVLIVTMVVVSALVLWHEQRILEAELRSRAELLARVLALAAADGGSPEHLAVISMTDIRAGEVRDENGTVLWRYGPSPAEVEVLDTSVLRVEQRVEIGRGPMGRDTAVDVMLLVSRARVRSHLAVAAIRLLIGLGIAMTLAMIAGLALVGRVVRPLQQLAAWVRRFDPDESVEPPLAGGPSAEVRDLAAAFRGMTRRLADQRRSLVASERRFRELFTASPTPLLRLDQELSLRDSNPAAAPYLGAESGRTLGSSLAGYLDRPRAERLAEIFSTAGAEAEVIIDADWRLEGGEIAEVELRAGWAGDDQSSGFLVAIHDHTDRVRRMGERWRRTFDAMVDGVALVDGDGRIMLANQALEPHEKAISKELLSRTGDGAPVFWRMHNVGRLLDCSLTLPTGFEHAILVVRDVTEAADAEDRLRSAEKMQAIGTLASGVAHDFNNLLAAILLHVRLLQRQPEDSVEAVEAIRDLAEQGTEVVRELLLFARRESSPPRTVDLVELVHLQEAVLRHLLPNGVEIDFELEDEPVPVEGDVVGLRRLLVNLVLNACDAVGESGGNITVRVEHTAGRAVLEVADDGPGISEEIRDHLFEPFFTQRRRGRGAGLGLAVVYSIVSAHEGEVDVRSAPGEGARFIVRIPLGDEEEIERIEGRGPDSPTQSRVLLVEPDGKAAAHLIEACAGAGLDLRHAPSISVAGELVDEWSPSVVVISESVLEEAAAAWPTEIQGPVILLADADSVQPDSLGPRVVRLEASSKPAEIIEAIRALDE